MSGKLTPKEAGKAGGDATKDSQDSEYFSRIGKMGGEKTKEKKGIDFYRKIGKKGGLKSVRPPNKEGEVENET